MRVSGKMSNDYFCDHMSGLVSQLNRLNVPGVPI